MCNDAGIGEFNILFKLPKNNEHYCLMNDQCLLG